MNDARVGKNFEPRRSEKSRAWLFPTPRCSEFQPRAKPKSSRIVFVTKNAGEIAAHVGPKVFGAIAFSFGRVDRFEKRRRAVPGGADAAKIFFVQLLQRPRFAMAIEVLANLESEKFQRPGRGCRSGTMRANDKQGRTLSIFHSRVARRCNRSARLNVSARPPRTPGPPATDNLDSRRLCRAAL